MGEILCQMGMIDEDKCPNLPLLTQPVTVYF